MIGGNLRATACELAHAHAIWPYSPAVRGIPLEVAEPGTKVPGSVSKKLAGCPWGLAVGFSKSAV